MDRLIRLLPQTFAELVFVGLMAAACVWMAGRTFVRDESNTVDSPPGDIFSPGVPEKPGLLRNSDSARWLPPLSDDTRRVLATGFPTSASVPNESQLNVPSRPAPFTPPPNTAVAERVEPTARITEVAMVDRRPSYSPSFPVVIPEPAADAMGDFPEEPPLDPVAANNEIDREPDYTPLPTYSGLARSEQLERIAQQADQKTRHGFELANRGAYFAARSEFHAALRLIAQGLDAEYQTRKHSQALADGLMAIKEAGDFIPEGSRLEADLDMAAIVESHRTPALKNTDVTKITPLEALRCYLTFAQQQLAVASGDEIAGSMALGALGKLHAAIATKGQLEVKAAVPKAVTFFQAALLVFQYNHLASNDLGVLLARCGSFRDAQAALQHSVSIYPQSAGWRNLTVVYRQLGQMEAARDAQQRAINAANAERLAGKGPAGPAGNPVHWVDSITFARGKSDSPFNPHAAPVQTASPQSLRNERR